MNIEDLADDAECYIAGADVFARGDQVKIWLQNGAIESRNVYVRKENKNETTT